MTDDETRPLWAGYVPGYSGVRGPLPPPQWDEVSQNTLDDLRLKLRESITESLLMALRGFFIPGPLGAAFDQLVQWAAMILDADALFQAISGEYEGDNLALLAIQFLLTPVRWIWEAFSYVLTEFLKPVALFIQELWNRFIVNWNQIDWSTPLTAIHSGWMLLVDFILDLGPWLVSKIEEAAGLSDIPNFFATDLLKAAWATFNATWSGINFFANPPGAIHQAWMSIVDLVSDLWSWLLQVIQNLTGISLPSFLATDMLKAAWAKFNAAWSEIDFFANPLGAIHQAWMAIVDLVADLWAWLLQVIQNLTGITFPKFLDLDVLREVWTTFNDAWAAINFTNIFALWDALLAVLKLIRGVVHWAAGVFRNLTGIDLESLLDSFGVDELAAAFTTFGSTLIGINWIADPISGLMTTIGAFIKLFQDIGNWFLALIDSWLGWSIATVGDMFDSFNSFVLRIIEYFFGATGLDGWIKTVESLAGKAGATIVEAISTGYNVLSGLFGWLIKTGLGIIDATATTVDDLFDGVRAFIGRIPFISQLTGLAGNDKVNGKGISTIEDLVVWFQTKVLTIDKEIPAGNLVAKDGKGIPFKLLGSLGVGNVDDSKPNLVDLNTFPDASVMQEGGRWKFDGSTSTEAGSGSAKVTCNSAAARMFSNKIPVSKGQLLSLRAAVKWSGLSNNSILSSPISIGVRTYNVGVLQQQFFEIASVATIGLSANSDWIELKNLIAWQVPPDVDEVRMAIGVNQSATAGTVWFDDIALRKENNLAQNLVTDLTGAWNGLFDGLSGNPQGTSVLPGAAASDAFGAGSGVYSDVSTASEMVDLALDGASGARGIAIEAASGASGARVIALQAASGASGAQVIALQAASGASGARDLAISAATGASGARLATDTLKNSIAAGYKVVVVLNNYQNDSNLTNGNWIKPQGLSELYVACFGGGSPGGNGTVNGQSPLGGAGGAFGGFVARQIDVNELASISSVPCTVGVSSTSAISRVTKFGTLLSSADAFKGYVATPLGMLSTGAQGGDGGNGGRGSSSVVESTGATGQPTVAGAVGGAAGAPYTVTSAARPGGAGQNGATLGGISQTGGAGGGGGGGGWTIGGTLRGGAGGQGGFPGGGGGGGGSINASYGSSVAGLGGAGGKGMMIIIYKTARTA